jgi:hypothetical protein
MNAPQPPSLPAAWTATDETPLSQHVKKLFLAAGIKLSSHSAIRAVTREATIVDPVGHKVLLKPLIDVMLISVQAGRVDDDWMGAVARRNHWPDARLSAVVDLDPVRHAQRD